MTNWESLAVAQLKEECKKRGLASGGKKAELVARLEDYSTEDAVLDAEMVEGSGSFSAQLIIQRVKQLPVSVLAVIGIMLIGTMGGAIIYGDDVIDWIQGEPDYQLIEFDSTIARGFAQSLVDLGHPEWEGRMSGTVEEHNTAEFIKSNFTTMGIPSTVEDFDVPMFVIDEEPELGIC
ncbi:MAG: SAP domain-containing protein, partial [Candidatus Thermoplasmatota archaeon]|nr:SAP domain-containing protein [Candidatus Thermoplasmatota archaeon]